MQRHIERKVLLPGSPLGDRQACIVHSFIPSLPHSFTNSTRIYLMPALGARHRGQGTGSKLTRSLRCEDHSVQEETDHSQVHQIDKYINEQNKAVVTTTKQSVPLDIWMPIWKRQHCSQECHLRLGDSEQ